MENTANLTPSSERLLDALRRWDQQHVIQRLSGVCVGSAAPLDSSAALGEQLRHFESWYPGGVDAYLATATQLFDAQQAPAGAQTQSGSSQRIGEGAGAAAATPSNMTTSSPTDPIVSWIPTIPRDEYGLLTLDAPLYTELEALGLEHAGQCAFIVVAGGLGERLGYPGIKLALPVETVTRTSYLQAYVEHILALERAVIACTGDASVRIPLAIMTSDSTHDATLAFLREHDWFGMEADEQLTLLKQDTVPCLEAVVDETNGTAHLNFVLDEHTGLAIMKPHGHGDVHTLLHSSGLATKWLTQQRKRYIHFIQDTNYPILNSTLPLLGASVRHQWAWAFTVVPRKAKDASGAIVQFTDPEDAAASGLFNVEYHELDQFLRAQAGNAFPDGDVNDAGTGFSPFPGNINHFVANLASYVAVLNNSKGKTPEIFNPKFADAQCQRFKSPARLECMMQDFPKLLTQLQHLLPNKASTTGLLAFPSSLVYSPCKNDAASAAAKVRADVPPHCASSAEHDVFAINRARLEQVGVRVRGSSGVRNARTAWLGIPVEPRATGPHVVFSASIGVSQTTLHSHFPAPADVAISSRSTLILNGADISIASLQLDGALRIDACDGAHVLVVGLVVSNMGYEYSEVDHSNHVVDTMRGYILKRCEMKEFRFDTPGRYIIDRFGDISQGEA